MTPNKVFIFGYARTPFGKFQGIFKDVSARDLGAAAVREAIIRAGVPVTNIDAVYFGNALQARGGQNPARQILLAAGIPETAAAETINKVCSSSLAALAHGLREIQDGHATYVVVGGVESMSTAPFLNEDGLSDAYGEHKSMGELAEIFAQDKKISRADQDAWAIRSNARAYAAMQNNILKKEIIPFELKGKIFETDECVRESAPEKIKSLPPIFDASTGMITAASASKICDGAAALVLGGENARELFSAEPLARVVDVVSFSTRPAEYTGAPVGAIRKLLEKNNLRVEEIDAFEIHEAFAATACFAVRELGISEARVNIFGGALAIGHPLATSGARLVGSLALRIARAECTRAIAVTCNGGGEAVAALLEKI